MRKDYIPQKPSRDGNVRHAIDTLGKWSAAMAERWNDVNSVRPGALAPGQGILSVKIKETTATLHMGMDGVNVSVGRITVHLRDAITNPDFDIDLLPDIRRLIVEGINKREAEIKAAKVDAENKLSERDRKLSEVLPKIIDEFGADVMQYGDRKKQKPEGGIHNELRP